MATISLRLPDDIETRLSEEARIEGRPRSELMREALLDYLARRERERFMAGMVAAARSLAADSDAMSESLEIANDLADDGLDSVVEAERAIEASPNAKWWE